MDLFPASPPASSGGELVIFACLVLWGFAFIWCVCGQVFPLLLKHSSYQIMDSPLLKYNLTLTPFATTFSLNKVLFQDTEGQDFHMSLRRTSLNPEQCPKAYCLLTDFSAANRLPRFLSTTSIQACSPHLPGTWSWGR